MLIETFLRLINLFILLGLTSHQNNFLSYSDIPTLLVEETPGAPQCIISSRAGTRVEPPTFRNKEAIQLGLRLSTKLYDVRIWS
jgi:hypothetical protein